MAIVVQYPWRAVQELTAQESPGAILLTDTKLSDLQGGRYDALFAKQRVFAPNVIGCYTSSNVETTTAALDNVHETRNVHQIAASLRQYHGKYGDLTELILVVSRGGAAPVILELMPPDYVPRRRCGIIGIGECRILNRFKELFQEDPSSHLPIQATPELIANISRSTGCPVQFGPRFPIHAAATHVASAFTQAIEEVPWPSVDYPIQVTTVPGDRQLEVLIRRKSGNWDRVTANDSLTLPNPRLVRRDPYSSAHSAEQLFD